MTLVIAHRGARSIAPENTLIAAQIACKMGADLWETDINITSDEQLILFHDQALDRCTNVTQKFAQRSPFHVNDFTLKEIQSLDAGSYFIDTDPFLQIQAGKVDADLLLVYKNEKVPTLMQGLMLVQDLGWSVNLELKCFTKDTKDLRIPDGTLDNIVQSGISLDRVMISSFNHDWLNHVACKEPGLELQALVGRDTDTELDFGDFYFDTYNVNASLVTPEQIRLLKSMGKKINLFTVNDPKEFKRFAALGVDGMFTDFPQLFCKPAKS